MVRNICLYLAFLAASPAEPPPNAVHLLGLADIARNAKGVLKVEGGNLTFRTATAAARISLASATGFSIEQETRALLGGAAGRLLLLAPFGSGRAISMIRTGVETIALRYTDARGGEHGCVLMLPKGDGARFAEMLETGGVKPGTIPEAPEPTQDRPPTVMNNKALLNAVIELRPLTDFSLPESFRVAIYEQLFDGLWKTGQFQHVYRAGDRDAETKPDRLRLQVTIGGFKMGNERVRTLTAFGGSTVIKANVQVLDKDRQSLVVKDLTGTVRGYGENIDATDSLARRVAKLLTVRK